MAGDADIGVKRFRLAAIVGSAGGSADADGAMSEADDCGGGTERGKPPGSDSVVSPPVLKAEAV